MTFNRSVIQYAIHQLSQQITAIKESAHQTEPSIHPKHPDWAKYQELKRQASLYLTAMSIYKRFNGIPTKPELRKEIRAGKFLQHTPKSDKSKRNAFIFEAYSKMQSGLPEIDRAEAQKYAAERAIEVAKAKEAKHAVSC